MTPSSLLTSILIAWKVLFAGCGPSILAFLGIAFFITSTSSPVVSIGFSCLSSTMNLAIRLAQLSSP